MLVAIDIGNTHITIGAYRGTELLASWRISSGVERTVDEQWLRLNMLFEHANLDLNEVDGCAISSVVPTQTPVFVTIVEQKMHVTPTLVHANLKTGLKILYYDPTSVGADRICNSVAAMAKFRGPLIIVDFGTATTFDVISENSEYLGGVIAPGIESSSNVLHRYAARLPKVELAFPERVIGRTTESSIQSGIMFGSVDMVNGIVRRIVEELGKTATLVATGGIARQILEQLHNNPEFEPDLTLEGLRLIHAMNVHK